MFFCTLDSCFQYAGAYLKRFTALLSHYSRPPAKTDPWTADRGPQPAKLFGNVFAHVRTATNALGRHSQPRRLRQMQTQGQKVYR